MKSYNLFDKKGELNKTLPKTIISYLGPTSEEVVRQNESKISKAQKQIEKNNTKFQNILKNITENIPENDRVSLTSEINNLLNDNMFLHEDELIRTREKEKIERWMSLRNRFKLIFKKYGFTIVAILTAFCVVIGAIINK